MKSAEVRKRFLGYFEKNGHKIVGSSRLVPENDPTILFTNAGMNQFKNLFLGLESRDYARAATTQKCVRAGGKHNDLENVGFTARHHTFFEMLGNFSFGDYFKKEAIHYAWDFVTKDLGLPKDKLYVSVFEKDDEAADIWHKQEGVPKDRIYRFGERDNFWRMGNSGPCGPCSEIFYDLGPDVGGDPKQNVMGGSGDRFIEFWNLVFMQFNEDESGRMTPLPKPSVDTGMGLERLTTILQGKINNFENDLFQTLIQRAERLSGVDYVANTKLVKNEKDRQRVEIQNVAMRVLADHARAAAFLMADGVLPSNDGRGYVLRRIMRRAIRYGRNLNVNESFLPSIVEAVITEMGSIFVELLEQKNLILTNTRDEEKRFLQTLDQGSHVLSSEIDKLTLTSGTLLSGKVAFKLYDTFGFPFDLTSLMARERGVAVDEAGFNQELESAREKARASWKGKGLSVGESHVIQLTQALGKKHGPTIFTGYFGVTQGRGQILGLSNDQKLVDRLETGEARLMILDHTCPYGESGGQIGDVGLLVAPKGQAEVVDTTKVNDLHIHQVKVTDGEIFAEDNIHQVVDAQARRNTAAHHSATHLLHSALRKVLGTHVTQAGSLVGPDKLRFDFTHGKPLTEVELESIETLVNTEISRANPVETIIMSPDDAKKVGALALFGEKYGDKVRVLKMGDFSTELCGGTHVMSTDQIRLFHIVYEAGVSSGVRRIEAVTADAALRFVLKATRENFRARQAAGIQENWTQYLNSEAEPTQWIERAKEEKRELTKQLQTAKGASVNFDSIFESAEEIEISGKSAKLLCQKVSVDDRKVLSDLADKARDKFVTGVIVLMGEIGSPHPIIVTLTKNLVGNLNAGQILGEIAKIFGGKGGGRRDFAQGAVPSLAEFNKAQKALKALLLSNSGQKA